jgi:hypothetical protein
MPVQSENHSDDDTLDVSVGVVLGQHRRLLFMRVPEPKSVKNRLHLCLMPDKRRDEEIDRVIRLGARIVHDLRHLGRGTGWAVLADPEGNEFCILGGPLERAAVPDG